MTSDDRHAQAVISSLVTVSFMAGVLHSDQVEHGLQIIRWRDSTGAVHTSRAQRAGTREQELAAAYNAEISHLRMQLANVDELSRLLGYESAVDKRFDRVAKLFTAVVRSVRSSTHQHFMQSILRMTDFSVVKGPAFRNLARSCGPSRDFACPTRQSTDSLLPVSP